MNADRTLRTATNHIYRRHRGLSVGAGLLCLWAFSPLAMASTLIQPAPTVGDGIVTFSLPADGTTRFGFSFNGSDGANRVDFAPYPGAMAMNEAFNISLNLVSAPALSGANGWNLQTGTGILTLRWEKDGLNTAGAPADSDWSGSNSIISCGGQCSVALLDSAVGDGFYAAVLGFTNPASASSATINYDGFGLRPGPWDSFNDPAGDFSIWLDPGLQDLPPPSAVPVPAAVWLFASGLVGLVGIGRRRRS